MGVIKHGRFPNKSLSESQVQADILGHIKFLLRILPVRVIFHHVYGHMDRTLAYCDMTLEQLLNCLMDVNAGQKLIKAVEQEDYITTSFPFERVVMHCGNTRVTASPTEAIYEWTSRQTARKLYDERGIVPSEYFDLIYWDGHGAVMNTRFNTSFATFHSKHIIGCCGVRHHLHNIDNSVPNVCPCCGCEDETTAHLLLCPDKDRTALYERSVNEFIQWMRSADTSPLIIEMVADYLNARNTKTMSELYQGPRTNDENGRGWRLAQEHDLLDWQNFVEGRISSLYVEIQHQYYKSKEDCRRSATKWATGFIENIIRLTHNQWTWRNERLHYRRHPGAETAFEFEQTMQRIISKLEMTDPEDLLPEDQYLLGVDPEDLMKASPDGRQAWMSNFESAVAAADHAKRKRDDLFEDDAIESQSTYFRTPDEEKRCVYRAGIRWRNNLRRKRIHRWKSLNFLGKHKLESYLEPEDSDDREQTDESLNQQNTKRTKSNNTASRPQQRQRTLNTWLSSESQQCLKQKRKKQHESDEPEPKRQQTDERSQHRQQFLNSWLASAGSQRFKSRRKKRTKYALSS